MNIVDALCNIIFLLTANGQNVEDKDIAKFDNDS